MTVESILKASRARDHATEAPYDADASLRAPPFDYGEAFSRNLGWLTDWEQKSLRARRVAIAGLGGVGGIHLLTLARFGIGSFTLADPDSFDLANFNRQAGASLASIGRSKVEVMAKVARDINPGLDLRVFPKGIEERDIDAFLDGADVYLDGLDFFALSIRRRVFARCAELGIPAVTAAPLGMGAAFLVFEPGGMTFEQYFGLEGLPAPRQYVRFLLGLSPRGLHLRYLADPSYVDLAGRRGPSTAAAVQICAGVAAAEIVKLLLGHGRVYAAPFYHQFDAYRGKWIRGRLRFGARNPLHRVKIAAAERMFAKMSRTTAAPVAPGFASEIEEIIDTARWAPSGDNAQPWTIAVGSNGLTVRVRAAAPGDVYDYRDGEPSLLSAGMLLETMRIAASKAGRALTWHYDGRESDGRHRIIVRLPKQDGIRPDPLLAMVFLRSVDRRPYRWGPLRPSEKAMLEDALGGILSVQWDETLPKRLAWARLGAMATDIRLRIPETFPLHKRVIDWERRFSPTGIPAVAVGLDRLSLRIMQWAFEAPSRMRGLNRLFGAAGAALQMDLLPGLFCSGFFSMRWASPPAHGREGRIRALLAAGGAIQRFWLTAARLGLALQPALATLIFAQHGRSKTRFTSDEQAAEAAAKLGDATDDLAGSVEELVFLGRIGKRPRSAPRGRSIRKPLATIIEPASIASDDAARRRISS
jgi:molybdopterin/thiamine biosynthesis adenylyltransferase/nitroreductase